MMMMTVVVMQRLSLFGCNANDVAKRSFVIIQRSQYLAGAVNIRQYAAHIRHSAGI